MILLLKQWIGYNLGGEGMGGTQLLYHGRCQAVFNLNLAWRRLRVYVIEIENNKERPLELLRFNPPSHAAVVLPARVNGRQWPTAQ